MKLLINRFAVRAMAGKAKGTKVTQMDLEAAKRIQSAEAKKKGHVDKGSFAARSQVLHDLAWSCPCRSLLRNLEMIDTSAQSKKLRIIQYDEDKSSAWISIWFCFFFPCKMLQLLTLC